MGGMFGESKYDILKKIPPEYVPTTVIIHMPADRKSIVETMRREKLGFPVIFKPDIGERGYMVKRIDDENDIDEYVKNIRGSFLIQEFVNGPLEFGVFYLRFPTEPIGRVISVVAKEMLFVTGDGKSTLKQLIMKNDRAKLQWEKLKVSYRERLSSVVEVGKKIELVAIGNHALGTRFIDANYLINERLSAAFDGISCRIPGFYFGRFDLRCASIEDLYNSKVRIMELNGCGAEPAHIYDTEFPLWRAFYELVRHWEYIFKIAQANRRLGVDYITHRQAFAFYRKFKAVIK